jgi:hypothetical protein
MITIDEATADLIKLKTFLEKVNWTTHARAVGLGIEALKFYRAIKLWDRNYKDSCLPGETEE